MHHRTRSIAALAPFLALAACGGAGGGSLGTASTAVTGSLGGVISSGSGSGSGSGSSSGTGTTTPTTPTAPTTTSSNDTSPAVTVTQANMFDVSATTIFDATGATQSLKIEQGKGELYRGNASTVAKPSGTISYNPRDGIFTLKLKDDAAGIARDIGFQDPGHRNTADAARYGEYQVPLLPGFNYLQVGTAKETLTFFYKRPVAGTFVTISGYEFTGESEDGKIKTYEQGTFAFGNKAPLGAVPTSGSGRFTGDFLASMIGQQGSSSVFQWIAGTSTVDADFAKRTLTLGLAGTVGAGYRRAQPTDVIAISEGSAFAASGTAAWTKDSADFSGKFSSASFTVGGRQMAIDLTPVSAGTAAGGASSIDGTFYGPKAQQIGGNLRITGGTPDQRVDIMGAFTGVKQ